MRVLKPSVATARPCAVGAETETVAVPPLSDVKGVDKRCPAVVATAQAVDAAVDAKRVVTHAVYPAFAVETAELRRTFGSGVGTARSSVLRHRPLGQVGRQREPPVT